MTKQNEKDAKRVPELRFKGFTDDWEQRKLGEIATIVGGGTPSTKNPEYWDGDINWYSPAEIGNQIYTEKSERQITELGLKKSSAKLLPVGTVLFTSRAGIGKTAILNKEACTNQGFQSIIPRSKMLNSYFLFSRTNSLKQYGETMGSGSTFVEVSGKQMSKMPLFIPNINEQSKIAKLFQSLDKTITLHEEKHRQLERLKKALLQKMFADKTGYLALRFKGFTEKWEQEKLGNIIRQSSLKNNNYNYPILTSAHEGLVPQSTHFGSQQRHDTSDYNVIKPNQITYRNRSDDGRFTFNINKLNITGLVSKFYPVFSFENTDNDFMVNNLNHNPQIKYDLDVLSVGTGQHVLSFTNLKKYEILAPSYVEQKRIGQFLLQLNRTITLHDKKIQYLKQLKRGLLQKMFV